MRGLDPGLAARPASTSARRRAVRSASRGACTTDSRARSSRAASSNRAARAGLPSCLAASPSASRASARTSIAPCSARRGGAVPISAVPAAIVPGPDQDGPQPRPRERLCCVGADPSVVLERLLVERDRLAVAPPGGRHDGQVAERGRESPVEAQALLRRKAFAEEARPVKVLQGVGDDAQAVERRAAPALSPAACWIA